MKIKASGRSALMLATGIWMGLAGSSVALADDSPTASKPQSVAGTPVTLDKYAKHGSRHWKRTAHRKSSKVAVKTSTDKKPTATDPAPVDNASASSTSALPDSVANAKAEMVTGDTLAGNAQAMSARANNILLSAPDNAADAQPAAETQVVAADQLNDVDRALHESSTPKVALAMASAEAPAAVSNQASTENSTWDQTSLIGKIFIGFGALLTMASAARMFMT
jgi:hypothetical protein